MMFSKYISKITNTIGTVNYLQQKSRKANPQYTATRRSSKHNTQLLYDDGYDVCDVDPDTIHKMDIDLSINGSRKNSLNEDFVPNSQIILSAAIAKLRATLFCYPLVFSHFFYFIFLSIILFLYSKFQSIFKTTSQPIKNDGKFFKCLTISSFIRFNSRINIEIS